MNDLDEREASRRLIQAHAEDGKVVIVFGGRDCDGVEFNNHITLIDADIMQYEKRIDDEHSAAEGPLWYHIENPSIALQLRKTERDLVMDAFENGHPHTLKM